MVYINRDGRVTNKQPWGLTKIYGFFMGIIMGIVLFLQSMIDPFTNGASTSSDRRYFGFGRGGGSGSGGSGSGNDGRGPRRPMGRIMRLSDITVPGGCPGGSCGR